MLAAILCATDSVAALTIVKRRDHPKLNSILFGEGVINDAVSILLFRTVMAMIPFVPQHHSEDNPTPSVTEQTSTENFEDVYTEDPGDVTRRFLMAAVQLTWEDYGIMGTKFIVITTLSVAVGIGIGLVTALSLK